MKQIRRVTVEIERRTLVLDAREGNSVPASISVTDHPEPMQAGPSEAACPLCGSSWLLLQDTSAAREEQKTSDLESLLTSLNLHFHTSASGHLWVCRQSIEQLKEKNQ